MPAKSKRGPVKSILAGGMSGAIEICITMPTEFVKTQQQLYPDMAKRGAWGCVKHTVKNNGVFGLYRGLGPLVFFAVPKNASRFFAFEQLRNVAQDDNGRMSPVANLLCGLGAGAFEATVAVTPMETLKVKLIHDQLQAETPAQRQYRNLFHGIKTIVSEQGVKGVYRGWAATVVRQGSSQAIRWAVYMDIKQRLAGPEGDPNALGLLPTAFCGAVAGGTSVLANTPVDVIKTKMQGLHAHQYSGVLDCIRQTAKTDGFAGFYKGVGPRLTRVCMSVSIAYTVYEQMIKLLDWIVPEHTEEQGRAAQMMKMRD